ncbi:type II toxin-antitoxin system RelE/ParE family toxin [Butyrivibrio proteoclasticus]|uniref:type II toxin-antitoxin system RelE/ParE family toxin n=1 Tax=Butyrivibrio proteoclasticus TaxID=43305 RepID=UPI00047C1429|nr:type II toxin-antitoxin system RelE/ParE family toxin [Butyrivibrio proteoclasticus]
MIKTFADKGMERILNQEYSKIIPSNLNRIALRKLIMIDVSKTLDDLRIPPANHLEALQGDREGQYSIRINDKYRICFYFEDGDAYDVEIVDYH